MSTNLFNSLNNNFHTLNVLRGKQFVVLEKQKALSDFVREVKKVKRLSLREITKRSGGKVSPARLTQIIAGNFDKIQIETLVGLADGLGEPEEKIIALYKGESTKKIDESIHEEFRFMAFGYENAKKKKSKKLKNIEALKELLKQQIDEAQNE